MRTTGIFSTHKFTLVKKGINKPLYLIPFGDVHRDSPLCHVEKWKEFLAWAKKKEDCYFLGMGDYADMVSTSERPLLEDLHLHDSTAHTLEQLYINQCQRFCEEISFMKGRLIGMLEGNHYARFNSAITTTQYMCHLMGATYLGVSSFIKLAILCNNHKQSVDIWAHHGLAGSTIGASITKVEQMAKIADAHIYLMGHNHRKELALIEKLVLRDHNSEVNLHHKKILLARTGCFLKGYEPGRPSYIADAGMAPTDLGVVKIEITPKRKQYKEKGRVKFHCYLDLHGSI